MEARRKGVMNDSRFPHVDGLEDDEEASTRITLNNTSNQLVPNSM